MQHVLRCWERQSDGTEYKKTLRRPGLRPDPSEGAYNVPANPLVVEEGLAVPSPRTPSSSRPFGPRLFYPHSKISSHAVALPPPSLCTRLNHISMCKRPNMLSGRCALWRMLSELLLRYRTVVGYQHGRHCSPPIIPRSYCAP